MFPQSLFLPSGNGDLEQKASKSICERVHVKGAGNTRSKLPISVLKEAPGCRRAAEPHLHAERDDEPITRWRKSAVGASSLARALRRDSPKAVRPATG